MTTGAIEPTGEIHEAATVFPMLPEDELAELAADIKANGLIHPIVLDDSGALIDGRNRLAACRIAGVEPRYETLNGADPVAYILSANVARRNLTKGQRAMAVAMMAGLSRSGQARGAQSSAAKAADIERQRVSDAALVLTHAEDLARQVMTGTLPLATALEEARQRKEAKESREEQARRAERDLSTLRANAPDLADVVADERMTLREAMAAWRQREEDERREREDLTKSTGRALVNLWAVLIAGPDRIIDGWIDGANREVERAETAHLWTGDGVRQLAHDLDNLAAAIDRRGRLR